ncbi:hypothetical protein G7Y89_g7741 [Cudoniella acicularis]|uniref:BHLH domain-containing protein n=1 Tax=Cudoniella acicularis TaxID=354080 RepID=A0A8H4RHX6_9HELO|nr:hypothetical protein G7Y89_g7741 [Cudoniella acicularis]
MGSSKPPNLEMPFGYSFDTSASNFPFPSPTAPAPGPSLLDDNESKFLDSFFDGVSSDHFDYNLFTNAPGGSETGFGWDELPPTFMGTTSSFGQQPQIGAQEIPDLNFNDLNSQIQLGSSMPTSTSDDVLAAATLLQNGPNGRSHSIAEGALFHRQDMSISHTNGQVRPQSISHYAPSRAFSSNHERAASNEFLRDDNYYADMAFTGQTDGGPNRRRLNPKMDIRWGSDQSFGTPQGFMAPNNQETVAELERAQIQGLETAFEIDRGETVGTDKSHPPSPTHSFKSPRKTKSANQGNEVDQNSRPRKRRKSKFQEDGDDEEDFTGLGQAGPKKRKSIKKEPHEMSPPVDSEQGHKRRKSTATSNSGAKPTRENLTEDQKRENHIKSEQKRRTLIREGFEDLGELVPGLRGGGFSKSAVLIMAADWLEDLLQGNEVLRAQLDELEGR